MLKSSTAQLINLKVLVTGADGFIGQNLVVRLAELDGVSVSTFVRGDDIARLPKLISEVDAIVHLAGVNRPADPSAFFEVNVGLTNTICDAIRNEHSASGRRIALLLASSTQAEQDSQYGRSKLAAEKCVEKLAADTGNNVRVFRLPGVFGKWCRPNYNSVVATFCHNLARGLPIEIYDSNAMVRLVYIDHVISAFVRTLEEPETTFSFERVTPEYSLTLGQLADQIRAFDACRTSLMSERVGTGLVRALYATYVSYLPIEKFSYEVPTHGDARGDFVEVLKTLDSGQISYFTAYPGVTRGGHYHNSKTEKFLILKGEALFRFRHILTDEMVELRTSGATPRVVDTIPGWSHDITNVGDDEMIVLLWANETFDRHNPDTVYSQVKK